MVTKEIVQQIFALHAVNSNLISNIVYGPPNTTKFNSYVWKQE